MQRFKFKIFLISLFMLILVFKVRAGEIRFNNPGFEEDLNRDGIPDSWTIYRRPVFDTSGLNAHSGSNSAKVNIYHLYGQRVGVSGGGHHTFSHWSKAETIWDAGAIDLSWYRNDSFIGFTRSSVFSVDKNYKQHLGSALAPMEANYARYFPRSAWFDTWVWVDDVIAYDEFINNGDFDSHTASFPDEWRIFGYPVLDCLSGNYHSPQCAIVVDRDNYVFQDFAVTPKAKTYELSFWTRAETPLSTSFLIEWYDQNGANISFSELNLLVNIEYRRFVFSIFPPDNALLGRLILRPSSAATLWVDDVELVWHTAMPSKFSPNNDGIREKTNIVYSISQPTTVTLVITQPGGTIVRTLFGNLPQTKSVQSIEWDGKDESGTLVPDGVYLYKLMLKNRFSPELIIAGNLEIDKSITYSAPVNQFAGFFPRGVWIYAGGPFRDIDYEPIMRDLNKHNFNAAILDWIPEERYFDALSWGEFYSIKCILRNSDINMMVAGYTPYQTLPEELVRSKVQYLKSIFSSYSSLLGYYIIDEPPYELAENILLVNSVMNSIDPLHPGFSSFPRSSYLLQMYEITRPAVFLHHFYPLPISSRARPASFDKFCQNLAQIGTLADSYNLPFWMILQAFAPTSSGGLPSPEEIRCQTYLSIAYGVKGIFYFMYQSSDGVIGLVDYNFNSTERYEILSQLLSEIKSLEALLLGLKRTTPIATSTNLNCVVQSLVDEGNNYYLIVVNKDCMNPSFTRILIDINGITQVRDVRADYPLAFYNDGTQKYLDLELLPGDGRIIELR